MIAVRHAWLQKHASPSARGGEFHWHPAAGDAAVRAACVERLRGVEPPAVLWELAPGRAVWARAFAAVAPHDGRRYVGLVLAIAEARDASPSELLEALALPPAGPWSEAVAAVRGTDGTPLSDADARAIARTLLDGGDAAIAGPARDDLPARLAELERWMPPPVQATTRQGAITGGTRRAAIDGGGGGAATARDPIGKSGAPARGDLAEDGGTGTGGDPTGKSDAPARGPVAALVVAAARAPGSHAPAALVVAAARAPESHAAAAWQLAQELAAARREPIAEVLAAAGAPVGAVLGPAERTALGASAREATAARGLALVDVLHAWGRGRLDASSDAATLATRLADAVALRALAALLDGHAAAPVIAEARWHALLPAVRRDALFARLDARCGSLRSSAGARRATIGGLRA